MTLFDAALRLLWSLWGVLIAAAALLALGTQGPQLLEAHRLPAAVEWFRDSHAWVFLALSALSLLRLRSARRTGGLAAFSAALAAAWAGLRLAPPLRLPADWAALQSCFAWLPLLGWELLALRRTAPLRWRLREDGAEGGRVFSSLLSAALLSWALSSFVLGRGASPSAFAVGASGSLLLHLLAAAGACALWALTRELIRGFGVGARAEAGALLILLAAAAARLFQALFCSPLAVSGPSSLLAPLTAGTALALSWAGLCREAASSAAGPLPSGLSFLAAPFLKALAGGQGRFRSCAALCLCAALFWGTEVLLPARDWGDLLRTLCVYPFWAALAGLAYAAPLPHPPRARWAAAALLPAMMLVAALRMSSPSAVSAFERGLQEQSMRDPSLRAARRLFARAGEDPLFTFLRAHTNLPTGLPLHPRDPALVEDWKPFPSKLPHVFVFVVDSLRRDHVGAYPGARLRTPAFEAFVREEGSFAFDAFTQYGGTGLSQPSLWAGGVLPHRQPPAGFPGLDNLGRLLARAGYRRWLGLDVYLRRFLAPAPDDKVLDEGALGDYRFCRTLAEVERLLPQAAKGSPVFVYSRPEDLHIALRTREGDGRLDGAERYAERVKGLDACFGRFVAGLKRAGLWERSLVVLTADHGELLGEDGLWGHADTLRPQVLRIPLLMRVPASLRRGRTPVRSAAFLTDLTPTLYALLGQEPLKGGPLRGRPLFLPEGAPDPGPGTRLLASSFSTVWGFLESGRFLFVADALNARRSRWDLREDPEARRDLLTPPEDARSGSVLRGLVEELDAAFAPSPRGG